MRFTRITVDARQMGGVPCIRGLRMPVATVVGMMADGMTVDEILEEHPTLEACPSRVGAKRTSEDSRPFGFVPCAHGSARRCGALDHVQSAPLGAQDRDPPPSP